MRFFCEQRVYNYSSIEEAETHIVTMKKDGWHPLEVEGKPEVFIKQIEETDNPYSVEFYRYN